MTNITEKAPLTKKLEDALEWHKIHEDQATIHCDRCGTDVPRTAFTLIQDAVTVLVPMRTSDIKGTWFWAQQGTDPLDNNQVTHDIRDDHGFVIGHCDESTVTPKDISRAFFQDDMRHNYFKW